MSGCFLFGDISKQGYFHQFIDCFVIRTLEEASGDDAGDEKIETVAVGLLGSSATN